MIESILMRSSISGIDMKPGTRHLSFDGDADRIVYYFADKGKGLVCQY